MESQQAVQSSSCIICAKRKVRCDRQAPCSNCKRRKGDICEYLPSIRRSENRRRDDSFVGLQQTCIERPEQYIPIADQNFERLQSNGAVRQGSQTPGSAMTAASPSLNQGTKRSHDGVPRTNETRFPRQEAGLVEHNKQTAYIDSPVWYSWNEARRPGNETHEFQQESHSSQQPRKNISTGYCKGLLDLHIIPSDVALYRNNPPAEQVRALWQTFLVNVHPVVKIFFDWEKEPMMEKAASDPASLSSAQQVLCFACYFIAALSLSEDECKDLLDGSSKATVLDKFQSTVETALESVNYASTSDLQVLQAFMLYLLAIRNRVKPATTFSMMGIALRIAQRLGLHRDGSFLGISPLRAEERRRTWWQLQYMEISISQLVGCISVTLFAGWDTKQPANLEDRDFHPDMDNLPPDRRGLTSMSHCLWRYYVLHLQREERGRDQSATWITQQQVLLSESESPVARFRHRLAERFLQHCELVEPLHIHIQIGINSFLLAMERGIRQPGIASARLSEMPLGERDGFLKICVRCMEYYILAETTPSIRHLRWHTENYFQWTALVYIAVEAHHRAATSEATTLWTLINRVCELHPKLTTAVELPEVYAIARLIVLAWQQRQEYLRSLQQGSGEKPWCVGELERALGVKVGAEDTGGQGDGSKEGEMGLFQGEFDFDFVDWGFWETGRFGVDA